jgi:2-methylisocitrate lyase-like PEP mutase family enzyme
MGEGILMRKRLRELLAADTMAVGPLLFDGLQAKIAQAAGFPLVYMSGAGTAAARGYPDVGLITMTEMVQNLRYIAAAVEVPVISDADTGYGNPLNVWRTVREYEDAGAAALHIEDQVFPKRCGFLAGKQVIPQAEMATKVRAACEARRDPNLVIIGRCDALAVNGWDDVERRCRAYREAGADLIFVDGIKTRDDLDTYAKRLGDLPLLYNGQLLPVAELARFPFRVNINATVLEVLFRTLQSAMAELRTTGTVAGVKNRNYDFVNDFFTVLGLGHIMELEKRYSS